MSCLYRVIDMLSFVRSFPFSFVVFISLMINIYRNDEIPDCAPSLPAARAANPPMTIHLSTQGGQASHHPANRDGEHPPSRHRMSGSCTRVRGPWCRVATRVGRERDHGSHARRVHVVDIGIRNIGKWHGTEDGEAAHEEIR